jgi:abhydrolase domain-containing protein 14
MIELKIKRDLLLFPPFGSGFIQHLRTVIYRLVSFSCKQVLFSKLFRWLLVKENLSETYAKVDELKIRYWQNSDSTKNSEKPTVVLFHGNAFSLDNWKETKTLDTLTKEGYPVYAIDLPAGNGSKSDKVEPAKFREYKDLVPTIEKIFAKLGINFRDLIIVGPSVGGGFAVSYALAHPKRVVGLVLIAPALHNLGDEEENRVSELEMPVLLVWGDKDTLIPVDKYGKGLKNELARAKLLIVKDAGHAVYLEKPSEFNELLADFLSEIT